MGKQEHRVRVDNGKYEFICCEDGTIDVFRHGEPWLQRCMPQNGIHSLMCELDAARVVVQAARDAVDAPTLRRKEFLQDALALHDRLVSDREPPSAWCGAGQSTEPTGNSASVDDRVLDATLNEARKVGKLTPELRERIHASYFEATPAATISEDGEIIRAWLRIDTAATIADLEALWRKLDTVKLGPSDWADANRRYEERKAWILAHGEP